METALELRSRNRAARDRRRRHRQRLHRAVAGCRETRRGGARDGHLRTSARSGAGERPETRPRRTRCVSPGSAPRAPVGARGTRRPRRQQSPLRGPERASLARAGGARARAWGRRSSRRAMRPGSTAGWRQTLSPGCARAATWRSRSRRRSRPWSNASSQTPDSPTCSRPTTSPAGPAWCAGAAHPAERRSVRLAGMAQPRRSQADKGRATLRAALLAWYDRHRRDLPWRRTRDPYRIWVSEVMLQQTTVKTVLPYYTGFVNRFPTLQALAEEPEEEVLAAWSGLGYYHRARNLHRGAQHVAERHAGRFPRSLRVRAGRARASASTRRAPCSRSRTACRCRWSTGTCRRVLARLLALRGPQFRKDGPYYNRAEELLDPRASRRLEPGADGARRDRVPADEAGLPGAARCASAARRAPSGSPSSCPRAVRGGRRWT